MKKNYILPVILVAGIIILLVFGIYWTYYRSQAPAVNVPITNQPVINEPVVNTPPYVNTKSNLITVSNPQPYELITSPVTISGQARGTWYFEASFPVVLQDANGKILAQAPAQATGDWMTENFVPFKLTLDFIQPTTDTGSLILKKDNPSGLPQNDDQLIIPIKFTTPTVSNSGCKISGCSGEICASEEKLSACIYRNEFACYKGATCEKQANGECGWTQTAELTSCISNAQQRK